MYTALVSDPADAITDTRYSYDNLGRLSEVSLVEVADTTLSTPEDTTYAYDLLGNLDLQILPNGVITDYLYNDVSQSPLNPPLLTSSRPGRPVGDSFLHL